MPVIILTEGLPSKVKERSVEVEEMVKMSMQPVSHAISH
jgi:hypothetical protein